MQDRELYQRILGLHSPWSVGTIQLDVERRRVEVSGEHPDGTKFPCPECGRALGWHCWEWGVAEWVPLALPVPMCEHGSPSIQRKSTGMGHRKLLRRFHDPGHLHEFTFSCFQCRQLLVKDAWLKLLAGTLTT